MKGGLDIISKKELPGGTLNSLSVSHSTTTHNIIILILFHHILLFRRADTSISGSKCQLWLHSLHFHWTLSVSKCRGEQKVCSPCCSICKSLLNICCLILRSWIWERWGKVSWLACRMTVTNDISWCATRWFVVQRVLNHFPLEVYLGVGLWDLMISPIHLRKLVRMFVESVPENGIRPMERIC